MPKVNVESAIKKASSKDSENYKEVVYEGYGPNGIAILVETTTDNPTRTVANIRMYFNKSGGSMGTSGSVDFMFTRKSMFRIKKDAMPNYEEVEFEMIDFGLDEIKIEEDELVIYANFEDYGTMQGFLEGKGIEIEEASLVRIPNMTKELNDEQAEAIFKLIDKFDDDDDVANVFHTMDMSE
jgi:YebC/PmpR family DNA-binding regulatory protein